MDRQVLFEPIGELAKRIKRRKLSPIELTNAYLDRIEKLSPKLNAFTTVTHNLAMQQARQAEAEIKADLYRGPLHGIPYAIKDLFAVKGYPTTWGARPYAEQTFDEDATVVKRLKDAGAILLGKCSMSELAGGPPNASLTGACRTPWDLNRWSGGSSSGSGSAVAAGLCVFAIGTETWGSIMTPASYCGVTGFRPSFGRISRAGAMTLSWTMDKVGPLCRSAEDCATVFLALAGKDIKDPTTIDEQPKVSLQKAREQTDSLRAGFIREDYAQWGEQEVGDAFKEALKTLASIGIAAVEIPLPDRPYETVASTIIAAEEASAFEPLVRGGKIGGLIDPDRRGEILGGQFITAVDYLRCQRIRTEIATTFETIFDSVDILLGSSTLTCAPPIEADMKTIFAGGNSIEAAENLLGLPAVSVPCGFNEKNLPIGLKIIGPPHAEANILRLGHVYQSLTEWHGRHPRI